MEVKRKYRKKNKRNKRKDSQSEDQESHQSQHSQEPSKKSKKIQKKNYSNKEIVLKAQSVVQGDLTKYKDDYFDQYLIPIHKTVNQYQEKHPLPNIDKIFSNDKPSLVFQIKDDIDENLEAYFQLINSVQKQIKIEKIGLRSSDNQQKLQISYIKQSVNNDQEGEATISPNRILTEKEYMILKHRSQSLNQLDKKIRHDIQFEDYSIAKDPYKLIQLFSLCKMSMDYQRQIRAKMGGLFKRQDPFSQYKKPNLIEKYKKLENELMAANNIKNLQRSFSQTPIDFFNYHKANQQYEKNFQQIRFQKILTLPRFKQYVRSKKPEVDKQAKKLLHTACSGCFSQFSQISNPIQNCPQCSIRIHLHCQNIERRCHRCSYNRTSNQQKKITSYCYICNRKNEKGLMILTVTNNYPHQYAHIYCLLLHGLWTIQNKQMVGIYDKPELQNDDCTYCQKNQGLFFYSSCCGKPMHGMCAYLDGVSMKMRRDGKEYLVELICCTDAQLQQRFKYQRRFKINFQKIIFKPKKEELYNYIVKWEKKTKEYKL